MRQPAETTRASPFSR